MKSVSVPQEDKKHCNLTQGVNLQPIMPTFSQAFKLGRNVGSKKSGASVKNMHVACLAVKLHGGVQMNQRKPEKGDLNIGVHATIKLDE